jgi:DNA-binding GntR family transcriptional regulator
MITDIGAVPLKTFTLRDRIVEVIREAITSGKLNPGDRLVELQLAKQLGVGTTAVREALFELERSGFVTRIPNKGSFINKMTSDDAQQTFRVRSELEGLAVELAVENATPSDFQELQHLIDAMKATAEAGDFEAFYRNDLNFHRGLWRLSRNRYLENCLEILVVPLFAFFVVRTRSEQRNDLLGSAQRHQRLLDKIIKGDNVREHMVSSLGVSLSFWQTENGDRTRESDPR